MAAALNVTVLRVFCGSGGEGGNKLGVVLDGAVVPPDDRQGLAAFLGYSETVFVDDAASGRVRIFTPEMELPFAGHPAVGTGWLLKERGFAADSLLTPAGRVALRHDAEGATWASARAEWCPDWELVEHPTPDRIDSLDPADAGPGWRYEWAWIEPEAGLIRSRCFVPEAGITEDEATGSAAIRLCAQLARPIEIRQGRGSLIHARPLDDGLIEVGGLVVADAA